MTNTLTDQNISNTYLGVLHAQGEELPAVGQVLIYDGEGNATAISLGRQNHGISIHGGVSCSALSAANIVYPTTDGTNGQFLQTNGAGRLSFNSLAGSDLPTLAPSPANTYYNLSSITVDNKGRVTQVVTAPAATTANTSLYVTPITLLETTGKTQSGTINVAKVNMPSNATHAILAIDIQSVIYGSGANTNNFEVLINGVRAAMIGSDTFSRTVQSLDDFNYSNINTMWYAAMDGSNNISVVFVNNTNSAVNIKTIIKLLGYSNINTLSNS